MNRQDTIEEIVDPTDGCNGVEGMHAFLVLGAFGACQVLIISVHDTTLRSFNCSTQPNQNARAGEHCWINHDLNVILLAWFIHWYKIQPVEVDHFLLRVCLSDDRLSFVKACGFVAANTFFLDSSSSSLVAFRLLGGRPRLSAFPWPSVKAAGGKRTSRRT